MKLVIYNKQNSQPVGQRNGERTLRFNACIYNQLLLNNLQVISRKYDRNL